MQREICICTRAWNSSRLCQIGYCHSHPYESSLTNATAHYLHVLANSVQTADREMGPSTSVNKMYQL
jgi:hypothetical protein